MQRRQFIKTLLMSVSAAAIFSPIVSSANAAGADVTVLPVPELLGGKLVDGIRVYDLKMQEGTHEFFTGVKTPTMGINASFLGSTIKMRVGETVRLNVTNNTSIVATLHWHGLHLPAKADGGPHQEIKPGETWSPEFKVIQEAATFWYHSHTHNKTGEQVWNGLAGVIIVEDDKANALGLPQEYGVDDIPVVLQERRFNRDGTLAYVSSMHDTMMGISGDVPLVNGAVQPTFKATTQKVRLRLLNGSNASFYLLGFDDNREFHHIGGDGSLLPESVKTNRVLLGPAERAEIIVDVSDGRPITLTSFASEPSGSGMNGMMGGMRRGMMGGGGSTPFEFLRIEPGANLKKSAAVPQKLIIVERLLASNAAKTRRFELEMKMGPTVMMGLSNPFSINGKVMDMGRIDEVIKMGDTEIWEIKNASMMPHPFHIHDIQFQILDRNGNAPHAGERGLKDTVIVNAGEVVRVIAKFDDYSDAERPYMYHCHILEHEDAGMMGQFTVVA